MFIDKVKSEDVKKAIEDFLADKEAEIITYKVMENDVYEVEIDSVEGVTINQCAEVNRYVNNLFPEDDYELTVASYSISQPFVSEVQFIKNVGREIEVVTIAGEKLKGELKEYSDGGFTLEYTEKVAVEGKKRKEEQLFVKSFSRSEVKTVKLKF